ncbi:MAG: hypothetical protein R3B04_03295 [Nitrospira sp.]
MLKPTVSFVLVSFKGSTYKRPVRLAFSLDATLLVSLFERLSEE